MRTIPKTNNEAVLKYNTCFEQCQCPDFQNRGGSYRDPINGDHICKHVAHYRANVRYAEERNVMITVQAYEAQAAKAKAAIDALYGKVAPTQVVEPTWSLLNYLEIDQPAPQRKEPTAEELFARFI